MLTKKSKYGLKAMEYLARQAGRGPILISELAERQGLPKKFLESILVDLKLSGLVLSKKGKGGGYFLSRGANDITVGQIVRALGGPLALVPCVSLTAYSRCDECLDELTCSIRKTMKEVRDATSEILDNKTLGAFSAESSEPTPQNTSDSIEFTD